MSSPNLLSTVELSGRNVVVHEEPTVHNGLSGLDRAFQPRSYQLEMLEESMRRNIIVAVRHSRSQLLQLLTHIDGHWIRKDICVTNLRFGIIMI